MAAEANPRCRCAFRARRARRRPATAAYGSGTAGRTDGRRGCKRPAGRNSSSRWPKERGRGGKLDRRRHRRHRRQGGRPPTPTPLRSVPGPRDVALAARHPLAPLGALCQKTTRGRRTCGCSGNRRTNAVGPLPVRNIRQRGQTAESRILVRGGLRGGVPAFCSGIDPRRAKRERPRHVALRNEPDDPVAVGDWQAVAVVSAHVGNRILHADTGVDRQCVAGIH